MISFDQGKTWYQPHELRPAFVDLMWTKIEAACAHHIMDRIKLELPTCQKHEWLRAYLSRAKHSIFV